MVELSGLRDRGNLRSCCDLYDDIENWYEGTTNAGALFTIIIIRYLLSYQNSKFYISRTRMVMMMISAVFTWCDRVLHRSTWFCVYLFVLCIIVRYFTIAAVYFLRSHLSAYYSFENCIVCPKSYLGCRTIVNNKYSNK